MATQSLVAPLQIQKARTAHTVHSAQPNVAYLVEYTQALLDAEDQQHAQAADAANGQVSHGLAPGATVDLSKKSIHELPVEVVELMKDRVERLALSHNPQISIPAQVVKCERLRYLNVRANHLTEFPRSVLSLTQLEILDLSKNDLTSIPEEIKQMTSLRFLAVVRNQIARLPIAFGSMPALHKLKFEDNPIVFPSAEDLRTHGSTDKNGTLNMNRETEVCMQVKRVMKSVMKSKALRQRLMKSSSEEDTSESNIETPRPPRRLANGRFPVRPSISGVEGLSDIIRSASNSPPDPLPTATSYTFGLSPSRDGVNGNSRAAPTSLLESSDDIRTRSESVSTTASFKARRQGLLPNKRNNDIALLKDAAKQSVRSSNASTIKASHAYKASSSSTLSGISSGAESAPSPNASLGTHIQRSGAAPQSMSARFQSLPSLSAARRLQRMLIQLSQPLLEVADGMINDLPARSQFSKHVSNANAHTRELEHCLNVLFAPHLELEAQQKILRNLSIVLRSTLKSSSALIDMVRTCMNRPGGGAEPFTARCLMFQLYSITVETRNVATLLRVPVKLVTKDPRNTPRASTVSQSWSSRTATPTETKSNVAMKRLRGATIIRNQQSNASLRVVPPSRDPIRLHTDTSFLSSASPISAVSARSTQRSMPNGTVGSSSDEHEDGSEQFERIFFKLKEACNIAGEALMHCESEIRIQHSHAMRDGQQQRVRSWQGASKTCRKVTEMRKVLEEGLKEIQIGDPNVRNTKTFWQLCDNFVQSWTEFATDIKDIGTARVDISTIRNIMKPVQRAVKDVSKTISDSSLYHQALRNTNPTPRRLAPPFPSGLNTALAQAVAQSSSNPPSANPSSAQTMMATMSMPATPLTAALGPAAQATVASTPNAVSMNDYFSGMATSATTLTRPPFERLDTSIMTNGSNSAPQSATAALSAGGVGSGQGQQYARRGG